MNNIIFKKIEKKNGIAVMYFHPWEILDIPNKGVILRNMERKLSFLKEKYAFYKIPMVKELEFLLKNLEFTNFETAKQYVAETL